MDFDINVFVGFSISIFYGIFLILFLYFSLQKNRKAPYLVHVLGFGFIGSIFDIINSLEILPELNPNIQIYLIIELLFYGLQFFFFYLFLEQISSVDPKNWRLLPMFGFLIIQEISLGLMIWFSPFSSQSVQNLWFLADVGYNNLALFAFGVFGLPIYYKQYKYTREKKAVVFILAILLITFGYIIYSLVDYIGFFTTLPDWLEFLNNFSEVFPLLGLAVILLVYVFDIDYLYRLPSDHYMLVVTYKSGITIHSVKFQTKRNLEIKQNLFSGFMTSISFVFNNILKSEEPIETISSKDATILMRSGEKIIVIMIVEQPTKILERAMDRYIEMFEKRFQEELEEETSEVSKFKDAEDLINPIFPFLQIEDTIIG
jgi:hypothetical protein